MYVEARTTPQKPARSSRCARSSAIAGSPLPFPGPGSAPPMPPRPSAPRPSDREFCQKTAVAESVGAERARVAGCGGEDRVAGSGLWGAGAGVGRAMGKKKKGPPTAREVPPAGGAGGEGEEEGEEAEVEGGEGGGGGVETRGQLLQRHKRELLAHRKRTKQAGKKAKAEMATEEAALLGRQEAELAAFEAGAQLPGAAAAKCEADAGGEARAEGEADGAGQSGGSKKPSRAQKRREQRAREEREREERIAAELEALGETERMEEERLLAERLAGMGLRVSEVKADGHCLFRAIGEQVCLEEPEGGFWDLRRRAVAFMRAHPDDFLPFAAGLLEQAERTGTTAEEAFGKYCDRMETSAEWGGQLELQALSRVLGVRIRVVSADMPTVEMEPGEDGGDSVATVAFLRHAFGLGDHYNSTKPLPPRREAPPVDDGEVGD